MPGETSEAFRALVRRIDRASKDGDHARAIAMLDELMAMAPADPLYSKKKSHFLAALAYRALQAGESGAALALLERADRDLPDGHMTPFLREERETIRTAARQHFGA
jgi:hypothetical protein